MHSNLRGNILIRALEKFKDRIHTLDLEFSEQRLNWTFSRPLFDKWNEIMNIIIDTGISKTLKNVFVFVLILY